MMKANPTVNAKQQPMDALDMIGGGSKIIAVTDRTSN